MCVISSTDNLASQGSGPSTAILDCIGISRSVVISNSPRRTLRLTQPPGLRNTEQEKRGVSL